MWTGLYNQVYGKSLRRKSDACLYLMFRDLYEIRRNVNTIVKYCTRTPHMKFNVISKVQKRSLRRSSEVSSVTPEVLLKVSAHTVWLPRNTVSLKAISDKHITSLSSQTTSQKSSIHFQHNYHSCC
jgi:hypothetical protein